ncbi:MAG: HAMP domain-containing histidine kinase [Spirochaetales bacterium]|nr:HAMP domain-containing histidine kinase [Spirochaetales bacterium]
MTETGRSLGQAVFTRFVVFLALVFIPLFLVILLAMEFGFRSYVYEGDIGKAHEYASVLEQDYQRTGSWQDLAPVLSRPPFAYLIDSSKRGMNRLQERIVVLDNSRHVVLDSKRVLLGTLHPPEHLINAVKLHNQQGKQIGYLLVGTMVDPALTMNHQAFLFDMAVLLLVLFLASLALSLPLAFWLGASISRPLKTLVEETQKASKGKWSWSVPSHAPREVQTLAQAFRSLGNSLKASESRKAELLADAAHELRTPLTVMRGTLEAMIDGIFPVEKVALEAVYSETLRLEKIVDSLRQLEDLRTTLARSIFFQWCPLLEHVADLFQAVSHENCQTLHLDCTPEIQGWGEASAVVQVIFNLMANASRYAPRGGNIWISVKATQGGSLLIVEDDGPGIPAEEREHIFERFVRLDRSRSSETGGQGLGLAITREIVNRHAGTIHVAEGRRKGARFEAFFPSQTGLNPSDLRGS